MRKLLPGMNFDVELANKLARLETYNKHLYRPNSYLHKWWARRCGSTFRLILKSLVEEEGRRSYYEAGGLEGKIVLDPMLGGGTTLHEAVRMGANVIGYDIDPIPVLQARATLSGVSLATLERAFEKLLFGLEYELAPLYLTSCPACGIEVHVCYYLYGQLRRCDCGEAVFVDSLVLRREQGGKEIRLCDKCYEVVESEASCPCQDSKAVSPLYDKSVKVCGNCRSRFRADLTVPYYQRYVPLVAAANCRAHGFFFRAIRQAELALLDRADAQRSGLKFAAPTFVTPGPKSADLKRMGVEDYRDLFSSRQLLYLRGAIDLLHELEPQVQAYLALLVSTSMEFNVMLCGYKGAGVRRAGAIRHAFSHHAYSFPYTAAENNPVYPGKTSGTLRKLFHDRVRRARKWADLPRERSFAAGRNRFVGIEGEVDYGSEVNDVSLLSGGERRYLVRQGSAAQTDLPANTVDFIVTDPPYFDSVQYSDLSEFFRVWLRQMINKDTSADLRWDYPLDASAVDRGRSASAEGIEDHYQQSMSAIFAECRRVMKQGCGRLIFSFHHWKAAGWSAISIALKQAGFVLLDYWVVHAENPSSVHIANLNALTDDAILVLAAKSATPARAWPRPRTIRTAESAQFCRDCSKALGWILATSMTEQEISAWWKEHLPENGRG